MVNTRKLGPRWMGAGAAIVALVLLAAACAKSTTPSSGGSSAGTSASSSPSMMAAAISTKSISGVGTVLVDNKGFTLYYRKTDAHSKVTCSGGCASTWPPQLVTGSMPAAGSGVSGKLATIKGANGTQLTYKGWPLYTYSGDSAPGQANGQGISGTWFAMTASGPKSSSGGPSPAGSPPGGGGYGY